MNYFKRALSGLFVLAILSFSSDKEAFADVYICKGPSSKKYHLKANCRGLSRCSTKTYKVSVEEARRLGRSLCGWED